jgi:NAD(P)-dependent dehydrogenase (short-subunit alcohol dehydrogenase family)
VLIVGGACGIGRIAAELLIARGDRLLVVDRDEGEPRAPEVGDKGKTFRMDPTN